MEFRDKRPMKVASSSIYKNLRGSNPRFFNLKLQQGYT